MLRPVEQWLEAERGQVPLWVPVALGSGICAWFALPTPALWLAWVLGWLGLALAVAAFGPGTRLAAFISIGAALLAAGCLLPWGKSVLVGAPPLARPAMVSLEAQVRSVEQLTARNSIRLRLEPIDRRDLPPLLRVTAPVHGVPAGATPGARVALRAYLMPPPPASLPGAYDYAARAWFDGIGATGRVIGDVRLLSSSQTSQPLRDRLGQHIAGQVGGGAGAIAVALATGEQGGIGDADADAMRRSGLAHLLSISGLHVSALIGAVIVLVLRILALSPRLALHAPLLLVAAGCGAAAGIGYTLLTGAQVPTIRSCIAALLVLGGLVLGREAISLRLVASGALIVMLFWPEAVIGPSFQMSFAAVIAIIALYEYPPVRRLFERREEHVMMRLLRQLGMLLVTGLAVEIMLAPIAVYHFHRAGMLGALANMIAIPLTSFVIMPAEALALILDVAGLGYPAWMVTEAALGLLLKLAHAVAAVPYAVVPLPTITGVPFAMSMFGLLWIMLWRGSVRWLGIPALAAGFGGMVLASPADMLVTRDGRHVALRMADGRVGLLRPRAGDYVRQTLSESLAHEDDLEALDALPGIRCNADACLARREERDGRETRILATRSSAYVNWPALVRACSGVEIVVSDRRLPESCRPRWLKLDRISLEQTGGVAIRFARREIVPARDPRDRHPWVAAARPLPKGSGATAGIPDKTIPADTAPDQLRTGNTPSP